MTTLQIETADPRDPECVALLKASHALMESLFPPEANNYLSIDALCVPSITFFVARTSGPALGCAALATRWGYGELKSMFVDPSARSEGVGAALLAHVERVARQTGLSVLKLETGTLLEQARTLYTRHGFRPCDPFGDYVPGPFNVFYEKPL